MTSFTKPRCHMPLEQLRQVFCMLLWSALCRKGCLRPAERHLYAPRVDCGSSCSLLLTRLLTAKDAQLAPYDPFSSLRPCMHDVRLDPQRSRGTGHALGVQVASSGGGRWLPRFWSGGLLRG